MNTKSSTIRLPRLLSAARAAGAVVADAMSGRVHDYTVGSIGRAILLLAIPMVLEMAMESVFVVVDIFFVARLGAEAVTALGLTEAVLTLLYATALGLGAGATALVARRVGEHDFAGARTAAAQTIWVGVVLALLIGGLVAPHASALLELMGGGADVVRNGSRYTAVMFGGSATILLIFLLNAIFRGAGNAVIAMRALWLANAVNILLDPCLIFGIGPFPELGVSGAAVATNIGRGVGVIYQLYSLAGPRTRIALGLGDLRLSVGVLLRLLRVSVPGVFQYTVAMSSYLFLMRIIAAYGSAAVAGFTIGVRIFAFTFLPAWGLANAAATLVGQNLGAGQPERAEASAWIAARYNAAFLGSVALLCIVAPGPVVAIFTTDPGVIAYGVDCLRYLSYGYGFYAVGMVLTQAFNGAGDTDTPTYINLFCFWLLQIPLAYLLAEVLGYGPHGVYVTIAISDTLVALIAFVMFRRGRWKTRVL